LLEQGASFVARQHPTQRVNDALAQAMDARLHEK
jgi:hypothetical protein